MYNYNYSEDYFMHYGIKGQKWGVRRFQKKDGTLTNSGKKRYSESNDSNESNESSKKKGLSDKQKKALKVGAAVAGTALAAYGGYKLNKYVKENRESKAIDAGKRFMEQREYLQRNISNMQKHVDPTLGLTSEPRYQQLYNNTLKSVSSGISGDRKLYGITGRNADRETKEHMYNAVVNEIKQKGNANYFRGKRIELPR